MSQVSPKGSLPPGWSVHVSRHYPFKVFYHNIFTKDSVWECPQLQPPRVLSSEELKSQATMNNTESHTSPMSKTEDSSQNPEQGPKPCTPPTAVVVPVVHKQRKNSPLELQKKPSKRKLEKETCVTNPLCSTPQFSKLKKEKVKKKKISPLNKSSSKESSDQDNVVNSPPAEKLAEGKNVSPRPSTSENCIKDVEMRDVSMDILDDLQEKKETVFDTTACYYIVVDTNVLIREMHLISELKDTPLDGCGPPHIFIPWVVIEELDKLKNQRNIKVDVSKAIRYLNSVLGKHPRFHGQSPAEAEEWSKTYSKCNDDKILECCLALQDKMPAEKVILLTNDKNLVNKALICEINVHNFDSMMEKVKPDTTFNYQELKRKKRKDVAIYEDSKSSTVPLDSAQEKYLQNKRDRCKRNIHSVMSNARLILKGVLSKFFSKEMFEAYGDTWLHFKIDEKLLPGILKGITDYWKAVFSCFFTEKDKRNFELLLEKVTRPEGFFGDKDECLVILSAIEDVFRQIQRRQPSLKVPVEQIELYRVSCVSSFVDYFEAESSIRTEEAKCVQKLLDDNWAVINNLCGIILDYYNVSHDFDYEKPSQPLPDLQIRIIITTLYPAVQLFKNLFTRIYEAVKNCKPIKKMNKNLAVALIQFIPSLRLPDLSTSYPFFNPKALERFFVSPQNREMIEVGIKQIEKFYTKLDEALSAMLQCRHLKDKSPTPETMVCDD